MLHVVSIVPEVSRSQCSIVLKKIINYKWRINKTLYINFWHYKMMIITS